MNRHSSKTAQIPTTLGFKWLIFQRYRSHPVGHGREGFNHDPVGEHYNFRNNSGPGFIMETNSRHTRCCPGYFDISGFDVCGKLSGCRLITGKCGLYRITFVPNYFFRTGSAGILKI